MSKIRWGILGTGRVAAGFARDLATVPGAELLAVASRTHEQAATFAAMLGIPRAYAGYEALATDPDVDVVYVATPNAFHKDHCLLCLENGKAVLCEKPFALDAAQARQVIEVARGKGLFCMEAMWMRFIPLMRLLPALAHSDSIGDIRMVTIQLGFSNIVEPGRGVFDPTLGGGTLLDLGIYALSLASQLLGTPARIDSQAVIGTTGVDEQMAALLAYAGGQQAILTASLRNQTSNDAMIMGTRGYIHVHAPVYSPTRLSLVRTPPIMASSPRPPSLLRTIYARVRQYVPLRPPGRVRAITRPYRGNGYHYEAAEVVRCLQAGELQSPIMPLDETVRILEVADSIRERWHVDSPMRE